MDGQSLEEGERALYFSKRALDADPDNSLALAVDGLVHTNLLKNLETGQDRYQLAIDCNPNNSLTWLLLGTLHAFKGEGEKAIAPVERALKLSPLDPHRYYYHSLAATAHFVAGDYDAAQKFCLSSLKANATHTSTLRVLAATQWRLGDHEQARATAQQLLKLEPNLTVSGWLKKSPASSYELGRDFADLLTKVGIPKGTSKD